MELCPETEEVLVERLHAFGDTQTIRVKINDLEHMPKSQIAGSIFYKFSKSLIDQNMIFRIKSTGEMLTFGRDGVWYEEGLNHELMI